MALIRLVSHVFPIPKLMPVTGGSQYSQYLLNEQMSRPKSIERLQI